MNETEAQPMPLEQGTGGDELDHYACDHDENTAFCGTDVSHVEFTEFTDNDLICVVCADLDDLYASLGICCPKEAFDG
jgi:hypothetical protein